MIRTRWKNIFRDIRGNINRFLSIMFIVALGAGFMAGLAAASPDMYETADKYIKEYRLFDIDIKSPVGFDDGLAESLAVTDGISSVQTAAVFDMILDQEGGSDFTSRVYSYLGQDGDTGQNLLDLVEGRFPENSSECVVESVFGKYSGDNVSIGDKLILSGTNTNYDLLNAYMASDELTVVGIVRSPLCLSVEGDPTNIGYGTIDLNVYLLSDSFTCNFYTDIFISASDTEIYNTFDVSYSNYINTLLESIKPVADSALESRKSRLLSGSGNLSGLLDAAGISLNDLQSSGYDLNDLADAFTALMGKADEYMDMISEAVVIYRTRLDLTGVDSFLNNVGKVSALATIFPVFFFIVALLVALTTMSRLVEENRLQIGTLKAIGYSNAQILAEYILFSLSASLIGCILGFGVGFRIFPAAINSAYKMMYFIPDIATPVRWDIVAWVAPVTVISILMAAVISCWSEFRSVPAVLMRPKAPPAGKRIWLEHIRFIWRKLSFNYKVTFRNLFRYKKRFIMTIIGVSGCSALLLTGFGVRDSVNEIVDVQFGEIFKYDLMFVVSDEEAVTKDEYLKDLINNTDNISSYMRACQETGQIYFNNKKQEITLVVPDDNADIYEFFDVRDRKSGNKYALTSDGIILPEKLCEEMNIKAGDEVTIENSAGKQCLVKVAAVTENYVYYFCYITDDLYRSSFNSKPLYTTLVCKINDRLKQGSINEVAENSAMITSSIMKSNYVLFGRSAASLKETFANSINSINGVIMVLIIAAGLLCMVVLYNLTNVNICERKKELATLNVLGFYKNETHNYIFRETNILSFIGAVIGLFIGIWLHSFVIKTVEINRIMFGRTIKPLSYIIALGISVIFTLIVDQIMKRPIDRTDMVEAMKAND